MILLVHMLFGAALGSLTNNIFLALLLAFLGHYFLDLFPHIEYLDSVEGSIQKIRATTLKNFLPDMLKVLLDFCLGLLLIFLFSKNQPLLYLYALVAIVPDGLTVASKLFPNRILTFHDKIHTRHIHYLTKQKKFSKFWKVFTQVLAVAISVALLRG